MKILLPAVLLIIPLLPDAKEVEEVEESARDISAAFQLEGVTEQRIVPDGFMKSDLTKGDLNGDGHPDIALITRPETGKRQDDGVSIAGEEEELKQNVAIFTGDKSGKYSLWKFGASHFIESDPNFMNPVGIGALEIKMVLPLKRECARRACSRGSAVGFPARRDGVQVPRRRP